MKRYEIYWDVDVEEAFEEIKSFEDDNLKLKELLPILEKDSIDFSHLTEEEQYDLVYNEIHHNPAFVDKLFDLPGYFDVRDDWEVEEIIEAYTDAYGFCINSVILIREE